MILFKMIRIFLILFLLVSCSNRNDKQVRFPENQLSKVISITDGDTFKVLHNAREFTIRLEHIDSPEKKQPFGTKSKWYLSNLIFGKFLRIVSGGKRDRYNRVLGVAFLDTICINKAMIAAGMAWHYKKYSEDNEYANIEIAAKNNKKGIWSESNPTPPWDWRKKKIK